MKKPTRLGVILFLMTFCVLSASATDSVAAYPEPGQRNVVQAITIRGTVKDDKGEPVIGATIQVVGTQNAVVSDLNGGFQLSCEPNSKLEIKYVGCKTQIVDVNSRSTIHIVLEENTQLIEEVVVIGYGTTTRKRATGAIDQVKSGRITERSNANMTLALQGASPSIVVQQRSFDPTGSGPTINIRGIGTMNDNTPLIVIDGTVSDMTTFNRLNPNDIEAISVLKDAGSAAIYGSRSANGVLLITTKKGQRNSAVQVRASAMVGVQDPQVLYEPVKGWENATLMNLRLTNGGSAPKYSPAEIRKFKEQGDSEYLLDQILNPALQQNYNISASGGGDNSTYMISAGYFDQRSNFVGPDLGIRRYNFRSNLSAEKGIFKLTSLLSYVREENRSTATSTMFAIADASRVPTYYGYRMYDEATGKYLVNDILGESNPLGNLKEGGYNQNDNNYINLNVGIDLNVAQWLKVRGVFGANVATNHRYTRRNIINYYDSPESTIARPVNATLPVDEWNNRNWLVNSQLMVDFNKTFGKVHVVTALLGVSNESYTTESDQLKYLYADPDLGIKGDGTKLDPTGSYMSPEATIKRSINSFFGRLNYEYDNKYIVEGTFRYDGSSKFRSDLRWGFFPSVSLAWRITQEDFMETIREKVGDIKLRATYGVLGNQAINDYQYQTTYYISPNNYGYNNEPVPGAGFNLGSENIKWEVSKTLNFGVDIAMSNSISIAFDYFRKNTSDILVRPEIPAIFGSTVNDYNAGEMLTQGWELSVNYALKTGKFNHNFNFSIGDAQNKVLKFTGFESYYNNDEITFLIREGLPLNSYYGYKTAGLFQSYDEIAASALPVGANVTPGDLKFVDRNSDGKIDGDDRYYLGNGFPRYSFSFNYGLNWKGFDLGVFLQGILKRDMMVRGEMIEPFHVGYYQTMFKHQLDFWTPTNTDAKYPQLNGRAGSISNNFRLGSDLYLLNGAYMRLKNIQLGYTFDERWTKVIGVPKLKVYVNAQNLLTFSKNRFIDPESTEFGGNMNTSGANSARNYPSLRYFGFGIDVSF